MVQQNKNIVDRPPNDQYYSGGRSGRILHNTIDKNKSIKPTRPSPSNPNRHQEEQDHRSTLKSNFDVQEDAHHQFLQQNESVVGRDYDGFLKKENQDDTAILINDFEIEQEFNWIERFCAQPGHEYFLSVPHSFIRDEFNLTNLSKDLNDYFELDVYHHALETVMDYDEEDGMQEDGHRRSTGGLVQLEGTAGHERQQPFFALDDKTSVLMQQVGSYKKNRTRGSARKALDLSENILSHAAHCLYGLIHARYVISLQGLQDMFEKYNSYLYGSCPLLDCHAQKQPTLPVGLSDSLGQSDTKVFCPRCKETFHAARNSQLSTLDGAFFGTSLCQLFLLSYPQLRPADEPRCYVPRVFGFKLSGKLKTLLYSVRDEQRQKSKYRAANASIIKKT